MRFFFSPGKPGALLLGVIILFSLSSCTREALEKTNPTSLRFAITGNSFPESPFVFSFSTLSQVIDEVNRENPLFLFHTGNMVHGGMAWMGINNSDMKRQYRELKNTLGRLKSIYYPVVGPKDLYNSSQQLFSSFSGRPVSYVVQYGSLSFVVIDRQHYTGKLMEQDLLMVKEKLDQCVNREGIFIITHAPWFSLPPRWSRHREIDVPEKLHELFKKYPVKAVIAGGPRRFYQFKKEGILYAVAGCGGFRLEERFSKNNQYYMVDFDGKECTIAAKQVKLEYKQR